MRIFWVSTKTLSGDFSLVRARHLVSNQRIVGFLFICRKYILLPQLNHSPLKLERRFIKEKVLSELVFYVEISRWVGRSPSI